jgi:hypothetical protein
MGSEITISKPSLLSSLAAELVRLGTLTGEIVWREVKSRGVALVEVEVEVGVETIGEGEGEGRAEVLEVITGVGSGLVLELLTLGDTDDSESVCSKVEVPCISVRTHQLPSTSLPAKGTVKGK